jgi:YVTN family beta-propeller protein
MKLFCLVLLTGALWAQNALLVISHKAASTLGYYTMEGKLLSTVAVGKHPHEMVLSRDGRYLYVTDNGTMRVEQAGTGGNTLSVVDVKARRKVGEISLGRFHRPHGIALDSKTGRLLVTTELPDQLLIVDPVGKTVLRTFETQGKTSHMVTLGPGARFAYVSNASSGAVAAIDIATGLTSVIATGQRPEPSVLAPDGRTLYVGNRDGGTVTFIDTARNTVAGEMKTGRGPVRVAVTPDGKTLVYSVYYENTVEIADLASKKIIGKVQLPYRPVSLSLSRDGKLAFASAQDEDIVYVVSVADKKIVREIKVPAGSGPDPVMEISGQ